MCLSFSLYHSHAHLIITDNLLAKADTFEAHSIYRSAHQILTTTNGPQHEETLRVKQLAEQMEVEGGWVQA